MTRTIFTGWALTALLMCANFTSCSSDDDDEPIADSSSTNDGEEKKPDAVDLGLPSGTLWATFNVGATAPEEYGDYFAWGEIEPHYADGHSQDSPCSDWRDGYSGYDWVDYKWGNGKDEWKTINKYTVADNQRDGIWYDGSEFVGDGKTELDDEDDVAVQLWGADWQMPTIADWEELIDNCTWTWTTENGVDGYKVTSKKDGYTDKSIFLPAAGNRLGSYIVSSEGNYWSRSLYVRSQYACCFYFISDIVFMTTNHYRCEGYSVRAVQRKK